MLDFNALIEFSSANCVAICAALVPANLLLTLQTMVFTGLRRPQAQVRQVALLACLPALVMVLHVLTWWMIGVVMAPTYILLWLASICLGINVWAIAHPQSLAGLLRASWSWVRGLKVRRLNLVRFGR
ncbi:MAG TPA: hypothetical protein V6D14_25055 [Coleofasciculaceae cyanobacterium]|jgi:hypothetical protein